MLAEVIGFLQQADRIIWDPGLFFYYWAVAAI